MRRFRLGERVVRDRMELRRDVPPREQALRDPANHVVVLGVHHHQRAFFAGNGHHIEQLRVVELQLVVGHVDLERRDAGSDRSWQIDRQGLLVGIGQDQVEGVIDHRLRCGPLCVVGDDLRDALSAMLDRERQDRRRPAECGRHGSRVEVVGAHEAHAGHLFDVNVAVDAAGEHPAARGIDVAASRRQPGGDGGDDAVADPDVRVPGLAMVGQPPVADRQVERIEVHAKRPRGRCGEGRNDIEPVSKTAAAPSPADSSAALNARLRTRPRARLGSCSDR